MRQKSSPEVAQPEKSAHDKSVSFSFSLGDVIKFIGALAVIIPLILGYLEYRQQVQENQNRSFREIVQNLSSVKKQDRLASASNLSTFLDVENPYYDETIDILINMVLIETDVDVLQAIRSSLEKISIDHYKSIVQKLLKLEQNTFAFEAYLKARKKNLSERSIRELENYKKILAQYGQKGINENNHPGVNGSPDRQDLYDAAQSIRDLPDINKIAPELEVSRKKYLTTMRSLQQLELAVDEGPSRSELLTTFVISFIQEKEVSGLRLYQNRWNYALLTDLKLPRTKIALSTLNFAGIYRNNLEKSDIENSTFAYSVIEDTNFSYSSISNSLFNNVSSLNGTDFSYVSFEDTFFLLSDLKGVDFTGAKGLKPIYFYKAKNLDKAKFDPYFARQLSDEHFNSILDNDFFDYVCGTRMSTVRKQDLLAAFITIDASDKEPESHLKNIQQIEACDGIYMLLYEEFLSYFAG